MVRFFIIFFAIAALLAGYITWRLFDKASFRRRWKMAIAVGIVSTNLNNSRADTFSKQGTFYERLRQWDAAATVYSQARQLRPTEDRYAVSLGRVFVEKARQDLRRQPPERERYMADAVAVMQRALKISPLNTDHPRNLAKSVTVE